MAILVTGGAGFIGSHFIERLLARGDETIICLDNFNDDYDPALKRSNVQDLAANPRISIVEASFRDEQAVERLFREHEPDCVVHLGAHAGVRASVDRPLVFREDNVGGTQILLDAARRHPVRRFVLISSSTVYGRGAEVPFCEDAPWGTPLSPYGATKQAAEDLCQEYLESYGVPTVRLRPFSVYGPRIRPDLAMWVFCRAMVAGRPLLLYGDGSFRRDFTHVGDVCDGILAALESDSVVGEAVNLGHGDPAEIRVLIALLEDAIGRKAVIERRPPVPEDMPVTVADLSKAKRLLGYVPRVALADGVREFVDWFRAHGPGAAAR